MRGYKFERRREVDRYVVDFYCSELHLAIDIADTAPPWHGACADEARTIRLRLSGIVYLPFTEEEVLRNLDGVVSRIRQAIRYLPVK
jgi:very-short-patch-repair endonuclease